MDILTQVLEEWAIGLILKEGFYGANLQSEGNDQPPESR